MSLDLRERQSPAWDLSFEATLPRSLVHKHFVDNVFVTDVSRSGENEFRCGVRVPRAHGFFNEPGRLPALDLLFLTEVGRQASIAISHRFFGVPEGHAFVLNAFHIALDKQAAELLDPGAPESLRIAISVVSCEKLPDGGLGGLIADFVFFEGDRPIVTGRSDWDFKSPRVYGRLRARARRGIAADSVAAPGAGPAEPALLGREHRENVVVSKPERGDGHARRVAHLVVDQGHAFFFDHPRDHIPGMLLLEGCAQLARMSAAQIRGVAPGGVLVCGGRLQFSRFAELDLPLRLDAALRDVAPVRDEARCVVEVDAHQGGAHLGHATLDVALADEASA